MIGKELSPKLVELEKKLIHFELENNVPPEYTLDGFKAIIRLFMSAMMESAWNMQEFEGIRIEERLELCYELGEDIKNLILKHTKINIPDLYK